MKLRRLEMWNFRAFEHAVIDYPESGVLLVAGANNSGKTALLSGFDAVAGRTLLQVQHRGSDEPAKVLAEFALDDSEREEWFRSWEQILGAPRHPELFDSD